MQSVKKSRNPRWEEEFQFMLEYVPTDDKLLVEVISASSRISLLHPKVKNKKRLLFLVRANHDNDANGITIVIIQSRITIILCCTA